MCVLSFEPRLSKEHTWTNGVPEQEKIRWQSISTAQYVQLVAIKSSPHGFILLAVVDIDCHEHEHGA